MIPRYNARLPKKSRSEWNECTDTDWLLIDAMLAARLEDCTIPKGIDHLGLVLWVYVFLLAQKECFVGENIRLHEELA